MFWHTVPLAESRNCCQTGTRPAFSHLKGMSSPVKFFLHSEIRYIEHISHKGQQHKILFVLHRNAASGLKWTAGNLNRLPELLPILAIRQEELALPAMPPVGLKSWCWRSWVFISDDNLVSLLLQRLSHCTGLQSQQKTDLQTSVYPGHQRNLFYLQHFLVYGNPLMLRGIWGDKECNSS